jgi:hypothetical protein
MQGSVTFEHVMMDDIKSWTMRAFGVAMTGWLKF